MLLVGGLAFKVPVLRYGWAAFLTGLLANMQERDFFTRLRHPRLCPVVASIPGGWLVVMRRARTLTEAEWHGLTDARQFAGLPVEWKADSFGMHAGRVVAVDYGS